MANIIDDATIEYVGILAKLELSEEEKTKAGKDMAQMLDYFDIMSELDTTDVEPLLHVSALQNVFREDTVSNPENSEKILQNAPEQKNDMFAVPKTI